MTALLLAALTLLPLSETEFRKSLPLGKGQVVLVNFWATWCGPCREEIPELVAMQKRLEFTLATVSVDEPEQQAQAQRFLEQTGVQAPAYIKKTQDDERFIASVDPKWSGAVPALFLYDRSGKLVRSFVGESDLKVVEAAIRKL